MKLSAAVTRLSVDITRVGSTPSTAGLRRFHNCFNKQIHIIYVGRGRNMGVPTAPFYNDPRAGRTFKLGAIFWQ